MGESRIIIFGINHDEKDETSWQHIQLQKGVMSGMACKYMATMTSMRLPQEIRAHLMQETMCYVLSLPESSWVRFNREHFHQDFWFFVIVRSLPGHFKSTEL